MALAQGLGLGLRPFSEVSGLFGFWGFGFRVLTFLGLSGF